MRRLATTLALAVLLTVTPAAGQAPSKLSPEREAALGATIDLLLKANLLRDGKHDVERLRRQCAQLPETDPLLGRYAALCRAETRIAAAGLRFRRCRPNDGCRRVAHDVAEGFDAYIAAAQPFNRTLPREVPDAGCRTALDVGAAERRGQRRLRETWRLIARSYANGSTRQYDRAVARFERIRGVPTPAQQRDRFVRNCTTGVTG